MHRPTYFLGLDLGQAADFSALAVLERTTGPDPAARGRAASLYAVPYLRRWELGTPYPAIVADLKALLGRATAADPSYRPLRDAVVGVDQTGVGRAVVDLLRAAGLAPARLRPVTVTAGGRAAPGAGGGWHVPKKDLVGVLQVLLQSRRLKVARGLAEARALVKELQNFQVKVTAAANETFGAWREGTHDDLVLAVAVAAWLAERAPDGAAAGSFLPYVVGGGGLSAGPPPWAG